MKRIEKSFFVIVIYVLLFHSSGYCDGVSFPVYYGQAKHAEQKVVIEGKLIPAYEINQELFITLVDLSAYGFDYYDTGDNRTDLVLDAAEFRYTVEDAFADREYMEAYANNQEVHIRGEKIDSYMMEGVTVIPIKSLGAFGTFLENEKLNVVIVDLDFSADRKEGVLYTLSSVEGNYSGEVENGLPSGRGIIKYPDGDIYQGSFENGLRNGEGVYFYADGEQYSGFWQEDEMDGYGVYRFIDGERYVGEWENNAYSGKGKYYFTSGATYVGDWNQSQMHGYGIYTKPDGTKAIGNWIHNQYQEQKIIYFTLGSSYQDVIRSMGTPDSYDSLIRTAWYKSALVYFDQDMKVQGWMDFSADLRILMMKTGVASGAIEYGDSAQTIINRYGIPCGLYNDEVKVFYYQSGSVTFDQAWNVKSWSGELK